MKKIMVGARITTIVSSPEQSDGASVACRELSALVNGKVCAVAWSVPLEFFSRLCIASGTKSLAGFVKLGHRRAAISLPLILFPMGRNTG